jgi:formylglycine-generating enzyme
MTNERDVEFVCGPDALGPKRRSLVAVIGIDRYGRGWQPLGNAVSDAIGTATLFKRLGFEQVTAPLLDDQATGRAILSLVKDGLMALGPEDSLVLFYAGHGCTREHRVGDNRVKIGYLIPADAEKESIATWIDLEEWLRAVSLLPAKHILVVLDACHSGIALAPRFKSRGGQSSQNMPLSVLQSRRSRRIITSALDNQLVLDGGPEPGHSLFTSCLIQALTDGIQQPSGWVITGTALGLHLQQRVGSHSGSQQTPDFGVFDLDDRGEMVFPSVTHCSTSMDFALTGPGASTAMALNDSRNGDSTHRWKWVVTRAASAMLVVALICYLIFSHESPLGDRHDISNHPSIALKPELLEHATRSQPVQPPVRRCPNDMVQVPAGTFQMGSPDGVGGVDEHPQHKVTLSTYCIDRTEVTVRAYAACVAAKGCLAAPLTVNVSGYSAEEAKTASQFCNRDDRPDHPINCVDWDQAVAYCTWAGKRLPTEAEWEYAARGNDSRAYPWGNEAPSATHLNACGTECVAMVKRILNKEWQPMYGASDGWETTAPVGSFPKGASPFGALDMAGNVWEWTADWYGEYSAGALTNPHGAATGTFRVDRGGGWIRYDLDDVRTTSRSKIIPSYRNRSVGFRCVRGN